MLKYDCNCYLENKELICETRDEVKRMSGNVQASHGDVAVPVLDINSMF